VQPILLNAANPRMEEACASTSKVSSTRTYPSHLRPTNSVRVHRPNGSINGEYVIDISHSSGTSNHLWIQPIIHLKSGGGNIHAKIWLIGPESNSPLPVPDRRPILLLECINGFINLEIIADCNAHPFTLKVSCKNGGVSVSAPTSFVGPLTLHTKTAWTRFYPQLLRNLTTFSDAEGNTKCFVGDFPSSGFGDGPWLGSSMDITCENGRVKLFYEDEMNQTDPQKNPISFLRQRAGYNQRASLAPGTFPYT